MATQAPRGFYQAAFLLGKCPMLAVEQQTGRIVKVNEAFVGLTRETAVEALENEPLGKWLSGPSGAPIRLNTEREGAVRQADGGTQSVRFEVATFSRQAMALQLITLQPISGNDPGSGKIKQALEREREKTLAAAKLGLRAYQLTAKLCSSPGLAEQIANAANRDELFTTAAAYLTAPDGLNYAGAAILLLEQDQLLLQHSTFPQPGRIFDRNQDHRYARMARGETDPVSEDGECLVPIRIAQTVIGYLVVRFHEAERTLFDDSTDLRDGQVALVQLLAVEIGLVYHGLQAHRSEDDQARDSTTGLPCKPLFERTLENELLRARRYERPLSVALVSADTPGESRSRRHTPIEVTEPLIEQLAQLLIDDFRAIDLICRYDAGVFGILLPETSLAQAKAKSESLRSMIQAQFDTADGTTISVGLASRSWETTDWRELLHKGGQALQEARRLGGNAVCFWGETIGRVPRKLATPLV